MQPGQQLGGSCVQRGAGGAAHGADPGQRRGRAGECFSRRLAPCQCNHSLGHSWVSSRLPCDSHACTGLDTVRRPSALALHTTEPSELTAVPTVQMVASTLSLTWATAMAAGAATTSTVPASQRLHVLCRCCRRPLRKLCEGAPPLCCAAPLLASGPACRAQVPALFAKISDGVATNGGEPGCKRHSRQKA